MDAQLLQCLGIACLVVSVVLAGVSARVFVLQDIRNVCKDLKGARRQLEERNGAHRRS